MSARSLLSTLSTVIMLCNAFGGTASAQGFAGLGTTAEGFAVPQPGIALNFSVDHGSHPNYRIEWWYLTANLKSADGTEYGVQWTLFRSALAPGEKTGWSSPQVWMGHAALTTQRQQYVAERLARGGVGQAGVTASPFAAWIDDWQMQSLVGGSQQDGLSDIDLRAAGAKFRYDLRLHATGPLVLQGQNGYSVKSAKGQASYYYSQPFYSVEGKLDLPEGKVAVTGQAWLDREWSSQPLAADQTGWDWFSLHLDSGEKLMGFRLRDGGSGFTSTTWISAEGKPTPLPSGTLKLTPLDTARVAGRDIPVAWRIELPSRNLNITATALNREAWMATRTPYWEGPISFKGSHTGRGYLEMTGY
jgi:predicted secreted hydrolase